MQLESECVSVPDQPVYLHYMNANVEGLLPHALDFGPIYGRLVTDKEVTGHIITVISYGMPRRYFVWSTFNASLRVNEYRGRTVIQGDGWHLCPPKEVPEKNISYLVDGNVRDHLFIHIADERVAAWLLKIVNHFKPPGDSHRLKAFLKQMYRDIGNETIENKIKKAMKSLMRR